METNAELNEEDVGMTKENVRKLIAYSEERGEKLSSSRTERFIPIEIIPLSESTAVVIFEKSISKMWCLMFCFIRYGEWHNNIPKTDFVLGVEGLPAHYRRVEHHNFSLKKPKEAKSDGAEVAGRSDTPLSAVRG